MRKYFDPEYDREVDEKEILRQWENFIKKPWFDKDYETFKKENFRMYKYKVVDLYEGNEHIGYANTMGAVEKIAKKRDLETDGECDIWYYDEINEENQKYKKSSLKPVHY